ncbi:hypothetical protein [Flagellimonas allohymeniacidonis]|uniref:Uncharacterized protein n=1 Tax=Flagellimonas allohymeniacidonis TaxID=2517819 RepID=A0A4Q8QJB9_9FLAO|nr:hypothetical protein [Allomuricauda hymeniacidonis]TAI49408.1 hypothetical protein EW142_06310 [Allomuricauda hymeniacidonis]
MKRILLYCSALFFAFLSCDSSSEDPTDEGPVQTTDDDISQPDETAPTISISSVPDVIEVLTEFNLQITDESDQVTTTFSLDGTEIFQSTQKNFTFELDPYDFDSGAKTLEVKSTDDSGNEGSTTVSFELRKLLVVYPDPLRESASIRENTEVYFAINNLEGGLVDFKKIEDDEDVIFFAPDGFDRQDVIITRFMLTNFTNPSDRIVDVNSYSGIKPGTHLLTEEEEREMFNQPVERDQSANLIIDTDRIARVNSYHGFLSGGIFPNTSNYTLSFASGLDTPFFVKLDSPLGISSLIDYAYLFIDGFTKTDFTIDDFGPPAELASLAIPEGDSFNLLLLGYFDESDYESHKFHIIHFVSGGTPGTSIEIPLLSELNVYAKQLTLIRPGGKTIFTKQKGADVPFSIPNIDITKSGETLNIQGEYDYIDHYLQTFTAASDVTFAWSFIERPIPSMTIPFLNNFEFPEAVQSVLNANSVDINPLTVDPVFYRSSVHSFEPSIDYENVILTSSFANNQANNPVDAFVLRLDLKQ